jgi:hypothetical protein
MLTNRGNLHRSRRRSRSRRSRSSSASSRSRSRGSSSRSRSRGSRSRTIIITIGTTGRRNEREPQHQRDRQSHMSCHFGMSSIHTGYKSHRLGGVQKGAQRRHNETPAGVTRGTLATTSSNGKR